MASANRGPRGQAGDLPFFNISFEGERIMFGANRQGLWGVIFISPWIIGFLAFQLYPLVLSLFYSFTDYSIVRPTRLIGGDNFVKMFTADRDFYPSLRVTFLYTLMAVPARLFCAFCVALLLHQKLKGINVYRTLFYIPSIFGGSIAISILWRFVFMKEGVLNAFLALFRIPAVSWIGDPDTALFTISLLVVWQLGVSMVLYLAGLKQVPHELYEAAKVDGAGKWLILRKITLPYLTPIIFFTLVMQFINAMQEFTAAFVITNGGPMKATYLFGVKIYNDAFINFHMGYASALSWFLFAVMLLLTYLLFRGSGSWVHYEDGGKR